MARMVRSVFSAQPRSVSHQPIHFLENYIFNRTQLFAASSLGQVPYYYEFSSVRSYASAQTINGKELDCSPELKNLHERFTSEVQGKRTVPLALLRNILEQCHSSEDVNLAFRTLQDYRVYRSSKARVKQNFNQNISSLAVSASLRSGLYGLGSAEKVFEAQKFREDAGLDHTIASAFAIAKAHILQGEPQIGADLISQHCEDKVKVNKYLAMLVRAWPSELLSRKEQTQIEADDPFTEQLKDNVLLFAKALSKNFRGVSIDAEQEFDKGLTKSKQG